MRFLVFQLYGPMVSWGGPAAEYRPTDRYPTRSAVIGLIAGALGIRRQDSDKLHELDVAVNIAVEVWSEGTLLRDYHTIQSPRLKKKDNPQTRQQELSGDHDLGTIISTRDYRADAYYRVAMQSTEDDQWLENAYMALRSPRWIPYLGRKACPSGLPFNPKLVDASDLVEALAEYGPVPEFADSFTQWAPRMIASDRPLDAERSRRITRRDGIGSRSNWTFKERQEWLVERVDD